MTEGTYLLEVRINGWSPGLVARFQHRQGQLLIPLEQFEGIGFVSNEAWLVTLDGQRWVALDRVEGLRWTIDAQAQTIAFTSAFTLIRPQQLHATRGVPHVPARADWGALIAWDVFGQWSERPDDAYFSRLVSVNLEQRLFSPSFTALNRGTFTHGRDTPTRYVRLDTGIEFDNIARSHRFRIGDTLTGGPGWVRSIRFGGLQWMRDFAIRPDIVVRPVPSLGSDVAAPSTVDVFVNGVKRYSESVDPGRVLLSDLPVATGTNSIRAVITDQAGRRTEVLLPFYTTSSLLAKGVTDFALDAGFPRRNYARLSNDYGPWFAAGSIARGVNDRLTVRALANGASGYLSGGVGATATVGHVLAVDAALLASAGRGGGWGFYGGLSRIGPRFNISASYLRTQQSYRDLAAWFGDTPITERVTASSGLNLDSLGHLNIAYVGQRDAPGVHTRIVSGGYGIELGRRHGAHLALAGYADLERRNWGVTLSLSVSLGRNVQAYASTNWRGEGRRSHELQVQGRSFDDRLDWELGYAKGSSREAMSAQASWEGGIADLHARVVRIDGAMGYEGQFSQSLILMGGGPYLTGEIDDGFTVVDLNGASGVRVALENRTVGRTGRTGKLLVADLVSYAPNAISIDPLDLPLDASVSDTSKLVAPRIGAGMVTRFQVEQALSAIVVVRLPDGTAPPPGAEIQLNGSSVATPLGFDGEAYLRGLRKGANQLGLKWGESHCAITFSASPAKGNLPRIGPLACVP